MDTVTLIIKNESNIVDQSIVIFQENELEKVDYANVWKIFQHTSSGMNHQFTYSNQIEIAFSDARGNYTAKTKAIPSRKYNLVKTSSGNIIQEDSSSASDSNSFEIQNCLTSGSADCLVYRDGKLLSKTKGLAPNEKVAFRFSSKIYMGIVSNIKEGEDINTKLGGIYTLLDLEGVKEADILLQNGNQSAIAKPYTFTMVITKEG